MSAFGLIAIGVSAVVVAVTSPVATRPNASGPITITAGGTYSGNWASTDSMPAVTIATNEPVTIANSVVTNRAGGTLIALADDYQVSVTLNRVFAFGGPTYETSGRFFAAQDYKKVVVRNTTIENTRGIQIGEGAPSSSVLITRNKHRNIQGGIYDRGEAVGNFVQFRNVQNAAIEVSWNEVLNEHGKSAPTDIVSIYQTANARIVNNYFQHQSEPGNTNIYKMNGITIDPGADATLCHHNLILNNQLVDGAAIGIFGGSHNSAHGNRIIQDGYLPDGKTRINPDFFEPVWIAPGGTNNHMHANIIGYINGKGRYSHGRYLGADEGHEGERAKNTYLRRQITSIAERRQRKIWLAKLAAHRVQVGA
jgi:hypothetical protein